jgi:methionyl-tRNA synthetase
MPDYLNRHDPDPLRYALTVLMPETSDSDFSWAEYVRRNNDELVARWGNLVNRVLTITRRNFEDRVPPEPSALAPESEALLARADAAFDTVGDQIDAVQLRRALASAMEIAQAANQYLDERAPWAAVKTDRDHAAETLYTALNTISALATLLTPFLPFTSKEVWTFLAHPGTPEDHGWKRTPVAGNTPLPEPHPLFQKLDDSLIEEEEARLGT